MVAENTADKVVEQVNSITAVIGTLVPAVAGIGAAVRIIASLVRPTDAQKAQVFDDAIAALDGSLVTFNAAIDGFEQAKASRLPHVDNTLPSVGAPDNSLPVQPVRPDNTLPPVKQPK